MNAGCRVTVLSVLTVAALMGPTTRGYAQTIGNCERPVSEVLLDANNVRARIMNHGGLFWGGLHREGYFVPKEEDKLAIFSAALLVAGMNGPALHAAAANYGPWEFWPGPIDDGGSPPADCSVYDRMYNIWRSDILAYDETGVTTPDLMDWPTGLGAPTIDAGGNPVDLMRLPLSDRADRKIDLAAGERPDMYGEQMVWWIMNDLGNVHEETKTPPLGIEVHGLAFSSSSYYASVDDATLIRYRIFNRSNLRYEKVHIGFYYDIDLGDAGDDFEGTDTTLGMGYQYNGDNYDGRPEPYNFGGYGENPPAVGVLLLEGPFADSDGLDNDGDGLIDEEGERLGLTNFMHHYNGGGIYEDPNSGSDYYNYMRGFWKNGEPLYYGGNGIENTGTTTTFSFPGDPVAGEFWSETNADGQGNWNSPGRRKSVMSSGPLTLDPGEETSVTIANVWARGKDHLDSVTELKRAAEAIRTAYPGSRWQFLPPPPDPEPVPETPRTLGFDEAYPNPASDQAFIRYAVTDQARVTLQLYDSLGRRVRTVVDRVSNPDWYTDTIDVSDLPGGVYFYMITVGSFSATRALTVVH